jgi:MFS transporter, DHA3 family, macrolide efflux protein
MDTVFAPLMTAQPPRSLLIAAFGFGIGISVVFLFFVLAFTGIVTCLVFVRIGIWGLEKDLGYKQSR